VVLSGQEQLSLAPGEYIRISIADTGTGIAKEVLPKIFDPYFSTKQKGDQKGMGLGLTICHAVVQKHGGAITVKSEVGVGTMFNIHLPAVRKLSDGENTSTPADVPRHGRMLVMDDEAAVRRILRLTLTGMGHEVELVEDGQAAIEAYKKAGSLGRRFDVVIMQAMLKIDPGVKAIAMSGYVDSPVILEPQRHGFKGAMPKPFDVDTLQEILARVMGSKAAP
jgi:CheY-like chemotaxis protein